MFGLIGPSGAGFCPPLPPRPFTPAGVKGSLNTQFGCFSPDRGVGVGGCDAGLVALIGERGRRSQWFEGWLGYRGAASVSGCFCARARSAQRRVQRVQGERSERAHAVFGTPGPLAVLSNAAVRGCRAGACLSEASLRLTPHTARSARQPVGPRPLARLFFGYFLLAKQKKVTRPTGRNRY